MKFLKGNFSPTISIDSDVIVKLQQYISLSDKYFYLMFEIDKKSDFSYHIVDVFVPVQTSGSYSLLAKKEEISPFAVPVEYESKTTYYDYGLIRWEKAVKLTDLTNKEINDMVALMNLDDWGIVGKVSKAAGENVELLLYFVNVENGICVSYREPHCSEFADKYLKVVYPIIASDQDVKEVLEAALKPSYTSSYGSGYNYNNSAYNNYGVSNTYGSTAKSIEPVHEPSELNKTDPAIDSVV